MLDIHEYNGQLALKTAGLFEEFLGLIQAEAEAQCVLDKDGNVLLYQPDKGNGGRPEVPRGDLRQILLNSLPAGTVRWGYKTTAVSSLGDGRHEVTFENASTVTTDLLVGATVPGQEFVRSSPMQNRRMSAPLSSRPSCSTAISVTAQAQKRLAVAR